VLWTSSHGGREALFAQEQAFFNVNTPEDLAHAETML
jgi:molybdopterin-guanine dinucleotide biosynthesis protein A